MQKLVREYLNEMKSRQKKRRRTGIAAILLIVMVVGGVIGVLTQYGVAMTGNAKCKMDEHQHSEACYSSETTCGLQEQAGHTHTDACYQTETTLVCTEEEDAGHTHTEDCYTEDGSLVCGQEESEGHTHTDGCYQTDSVLVCGQEESEGHTHTEDCSQSQITCGKEEHTHTDQCYIDTEAGVEDASVWEAQYKDVDWKDAWGEDLVTAAQKQIGYKENADNYTVAEDGSRKGYTRYGQFVGDVYCDWDAAFVNFCIYYAGLEASGLFPDETDADKWFEEFRNINEQNEKYLSCLTEADGYTPEAGDLIFLKKEGEERTSQMGVVSSYNKEKDEIKVIEGNSRNEVRENEYHAGDTQIVRYLKITELEKAYKGVDKEAADTAETQDSEDAQPSGSAGETNQVKEEESKEEKPADEDGSEEDKLSEKEQRQVDEVIDLIDKIPSPEQIQEKMEALEDDEDGYEKYYIKLQKQVMKAFDAYEALSEAQQKKVTNAEKLLQMDWMKTEMLDDQAGDSVWNPMEPDEAYVNEIKVTSIATGAAPFDTEEGPGNDTTAEDEIVRTFDTVTYNFSVNMKSWDISKSYSEARVKMEFVLPLTEKEAVFDQTAMAWMDQTEGYKPKLTKEKRTIDGKEKECQVLTCYKWLLPSSGNQSVVPGDFGENVTINVRAMKNGEEFAPIISAAMEGGAWDDPCDKEDHKIDDEPAVEKKSVTAEKVEVTAAPRYNIHIEGNSSYKADFDFQGDEAWMNKYGDVAANADISTPVPGRIMKLGITLQLYNDNASKGLKGIELPTGDITFDLEVSSKYTINTPKEGSQYQQGQQIDTSNQYQPLLWSYGLNYWREYGVQNTDGRVLYDSLACSPHAPYSTGGEGNSCYESGSWKAVQDRDTGKISITVSDYEINPDRMPIINGDYSSGKYGPNEGCFSSGAIWIVQPFNTIEGTEHGEEPNYDVVNQYGQGAFATTVKDSNLKATTISGTKVEQGKGGFDQMVSSDDELVRTLELTLPGQLQNRIRYASATEPINKGAGVDDTRDGRDYAAVGSGLYLMGGFSYDAKREAENQLYLGTNLTKFYGSAIELENEWFPAFSGGATLDGKENDELKENIQIRYATKTDGKDWKDDDELLNTYEDDLVFYENLESIPEGKVCVGILYSFIGPGALADAADPYYVCYHKAKVKDNMDLAGKTYMLASTSRVWTKQMFVTNGKGLEDIPDWSEPNTKLNQFPASWHYTSANIDGSVWYRKETYKLDGSGINGDHNSDWAHWGDTLLIIGYKTKVSKYLMQKDNNGQDKKTFNLDADQRVVDYKLEPGTYYDQPGTFNNITTVTIVDTLPKYLKYKPGSSYFGGAYEQTSVNGGTQGKIEEDTGSDAKFPTPVLKEPEVTDNADGTQTLTWKLADVEIGTPMAPIYYSADVGAKGNPDEDVPVGTTNLENKVYITAPGDLRDAFTTGEKHSEAGIAVTRGSASSFGKYTKQKVVDEDGFIDYVVYYNNNAETGTSLTIMDTMPMNQENGSHFTGTYTFAQWKLDTTKCKVENLKIYYTFDTKYKNKTTKEVKREEIEGTGGYKGKGWEKADINQDGEIELPTKEHGATEAQPYPVAWAVIGTLDSGESVNIDLKILLDPGASDKDKEENNYFVNLLSSGDTTTTTETPTVRRTLEGLTWMDYNQDGLQDEPGMEKRISGVQVELLKLKEGSEPNLESSYENVYYPDTDKNNPDNRVMIETGKQISVRAKNGEDAVAYETGRYKFTDLPAGIYAVRFTNGSTSITQLNATSVDQGDDDTRDSDAVASRSKEGDLEKTIILNLEMPEAKDMNVSLYESKYHDSGFYPDTQMKIRKVGTDGKNLTGAIFTIQDSKGETISFTYDDEKGYTPYDEEGDASRKGKYYIALAENPYYVVGINGTQDGALPILQNRTGDSNQLFEVKESEDDSGQKLYSFLNVAASKWLDLDSGYLTNGAKIHVWSNDAPNDNQTWYVTDCGGGAYISPQTGKDAWSLDLNGATTQENQKIHLWERNDTPAQKWVLIPAGITADTQTDLSVDHTDGLTIHNLKPGNYTITEIKSPEGYSLLRDPVDFTLNTDSGVSVPNSNNGMASVETDTDGKKIVVKICNEELYELPSAGGMGIYWYMFGGVLLMSAAALMTYRNKRREVLRS